MTARRYRRRNGLVAGVLLICAVVAVCAVLYKEAYRRYYRSAYPVHYEDIVLAESGANNLPPSLVYAVIRTESAFRPDAVSSVGARGLMQITEDTLNWTVYRLGEEEQPFDVLYQERANIKYGTALLRILLDEFGSVHNALCAYHAGWGSVKKWLDDPEYAPNGTHVEVIPFGDTAHYVEKVLETQKIYQELYRIA